MRPVALKSGGRFAGEVIAVMISTSEQGRTAQNLHLEVRIRLCRVNVKKQDELKTNDLLIIGTVSAECNGSLSLS